MVHEKICVLINKCCRMGWIRTVRILIRGSGSIKKKFILIRSTPKKLRNSCTILDLTIFHISMELYYARLQLLKLLLFEKFSQLLVL
jgi:hypothetical protein